MTWRAVGATLTTLAALAGCASAPPAGAPARAASTGSASGEVVYREDDKLGGKAWVAPGFALPGDDAVYVDAVAVDVPKLNPDGAENLEWAKGLLRDEVAKALQASRLFPAVLTSEAQLEPRGRVLRLQQTIVEYEKGGGAARFFAGLYGAGQPVITVRGRLVGDGDRPLVLYEARRSGDSGSARIFGGYRGDKAIQEEDIKDLAGDLADFLARSTRK